MEESSVSGLAQAVGAGRTRALALAQDALARADSYAAVQPQAWICRVPDDQVRAAAHAIDARIRAGERLPLAGVPFAVKDNIDVAGLPTTAACPAFAYRPERSATVVQRLQEAGAILLGKTNLDQFATGLVGTRSPYGAPACVYQREYVSGGSSSGSGVLVAAGVVPFALGTDTAGSGRVPAAIQGLVGFKPTRGRWSTQGVFPACRSLDCVSVFTRDARDACLLDDVLAAFDDADPYSRHAPPAAAIQREDGSGKVRIGVAQPSQLSFFGDVESANLFEAACARAVAAGAQLVEVDIEPLLATAQLLYAGPWIAERLAALGPFLREHAGAVHPVVRSIIQGGAAFSASDAYRGLYTLQQQLRLAEHLWEQVSALLLPTTPTVYRIAELLADPVALNSNLGTYTNFVNLLDMCALSVPAGFRANRTGFGASLIGPAWADRKLLEFARTMEQAGPPIVVPPLDLGERAPCVVLAVVGAHLSGQPLHAQLASRGARLAQATKTAPVYRLYAMAGTKPAKPALVHVGAQGAEVEVEVYELDLASFGGFVAEVPAPLAIGTVLLADGSSVRGFVAEPRAIEGAQDITAFGGWRAYLQSLSQERH
jgi:allophanate hydrolase